MKKLPRSTRYQKQTHNNRKVLVWITQNKRIAENVNKQKQNVYAVNTDKRETDPNSSLKTNTVNRLERSKKPVTKKRIKW